MKLLSAFLLVLFVFSSSLRAQAPIVEVSTDVTTFASWTNDNIYLIKGTIYIKGVLIIEPGTIIRGDKATKGTLVITKAGVINANAVLDDDPPILFTSSQGPGTRAPGDWGGLIFLGESTINASGGNDFFDPINNGAGDGAYGGGIAADGSGSMQKVRIEYAGAVVGGETLPGLSLCGVGSGTTLRDIQITRCAGDGFRIQGGTVSMRTVVSHRNGDDDFDITQGYTGEIQFAVAHRDNANVDGDGGANGLEITNDATGSNNTPFTAPVISNLTLIGPKTTRSTSVNADFADGVRVSGNGRLKLYNSLVAGYPTGLRINGSGSQGAADAGSLDVRSSVISGSDDSLAADGGWNAGLFYGAPTKFNSVWTHNDSLFLVDGFDLNFPDYRPREASPLVGTASFAPADLASFEAVGYRGGFGRFADWTLCWTNWNPANTDYSEGSDELSTPIIADFTYDVGVGADSTTVRFENRSQGAVAYVWQFGDVVSEDTSTAFEPTWVYAGNGTFDVRLKATGPCDNVDSTSVIVYITSLQEFLPGASLALYPNPARSMVTLDLHLASPEGLVMSLVDLTGRRVRAFGRYLLPAGDTRMPLDLSGIENGFYLLLLEGQQGVKTIKLRVQH